MTTVLVSPSRTEAFAAKIMDRLNGAAISLMTSIGHRTGLFDTMADLPPSTSAEIAEAAGLSERYVREWLGAMVTGGIVEHDSDDSTYYLPPEHAACLTRSARPNNLAVTAQWIAVLGSTEDEVVAAFEHGRGVPYSAYKSFHRVMAEESDQSSVAGLEEHILPLIPGLSERLATGIDVLDVACGAGMAMIRLAELFPASRFVGYDFSAEAIELAKAESRRRELDNVRFEVRDAAAITDAAKYDLVTAFDAIHDQVAPAAVLKNIARALRSDGTFLMQDIAASSHVHGNREHPIAPFIYTVSCMHCMSVSLAGGGPGLGAAWGKELALTMLREAGFESVTVQSLPHDVLNYYYVARRQN